jgi:hypothetical protein
MCWTICWESGLPFDNAAISHRLSCWLVERHFFPRYPWHPQPAP